MAIALVAAAATFSQAGTAKSKGAWTVTKVTDPITGRTLCTVSALDRIAGSRFSRVGMLYAVVENNPEHGLLVGVSSGGKVRLPVGDILWRIDDRPHRELKAIDNPAGVAPAWQAPPAQSSDATNAALNEAMQKQGQLISAMMATATMAKGETAKAMLGEMLTGKTLLFRNAAAAPAYGLPSSNMFAVGQSTNKGDKPIPIDESFRAGLAACAISPEQQP